MYEFLDRLVGVALPRIRDFRGVSPNSFDGRGNYTLGLREQLMFPEIDYDKIDKTRGLEVSIVTTAQNDEEGRRLAGAPRHAVREERKRKESHRWQRNRGSSRRQRPAKFDVRHVNRCKLCGRSRAYMRKFGVCRICFRELASRGQAARRDEVELVGDRPLPTGRRTETQRMSVNDPISDMLTRIRNARHGAQVGGRRCRRRRCWSRSRRILKEEGYIGDFEVIEKRPQNVLKVTLRYGADKRHSIREIKRVSKPGLRVYAGKDAIPRVKSGLGIAIVSTPQGVLTGYEARRRGIGGEVLCTVF